MAKHMASETVAAPKDAKGKRRARHFVIPVLIVLVGVLLLLYPVLSTNYNNMRQHQFAEQYSTQSAKLSDAQQDAEIKRAHEYNGRISGVPVLDPYLHQVSGDPESAPYRDYLSQLNLLDIMARVRVPAVGIDLPVRHDTSADVLATGAGHLYGTSLPVGGKGTHAVLTSHTGLSTATLFDKLDQVKKGDVMYVDVYGHTLAYQVDQIKVVLPTELGDLKPVAGKDYLTLFTCTPYAVNTHRLLVRGHRIPYDPAADKSAQETAGGFHLQGWMWWLLGGAAAGMTAAGYMVWRTRKNGKAATHADGRAELREAAS